MAIYHCSIKIISRGKGKSAVAAAAYRAGQKITDEFDGEIHDYTRKSGVVHTEILLPAKPPPHTKTAPFYGTRLRKSRKQKTPSLQENLNLPCPAN